MKKSLYLYLLLVTTPAAAQLTDTLTLSLPEVIDMARERSISARQAATLRETRYWEYRSFKSNYQPQLALTGILPAYTKSFNQVIQPDGTALFQPVHNNNSTLDLSFTQSIAATGGMIFGSTNLQRFDDFDRHTTQYSGSPYGIGYSQPLWQFNALKWNKKIEPLRYYESRQAYIEDMEQVAIRATGYYFDLLLAQVNLQTARTILKNTAHIQEVANVKLELGKISRNEILQLKLEQLKASKAVGIASRDLQIASLNIRTYTGLDTTQYIQLQLPDEMMHISVPADKVLAEAYANRSDAIAFVRRLAEAKRDVAKAKGDNGINAMLTARLGYSNSARTVAKVYQNPQDQQLVQLEFSIPILDWGRARSRTRTAEANLKFTEYAVEQDKQLFVQQIVTQVTLFDLMKDQLQLTAGADSIASEKSDISRERYVLGNLSITDLSIAFQEKDQARRDYIAALRDYWSAWYQIRYLSLYDFELQKKIDYK
ncbi:TolC family protein [Chitinophaga sp. sic0106]|uniref:TolC family protein n=1 Tax=Chitinophaga sp. sic0106 TaxID=2854785 RepID=UPI001C479552|nr:TolC family protein [Chitinophaga sp. sic0106]MBV7529710.1 TolC family protein [Chitinophaga sp. sic0106]